MLTSEHFNQLYGSMIAGSLPLHSGNIERSVMLVAQDILGVDSIHLLLAVNESIGKVFYFAVASKELHSITEPLTQLAAALPGHPDHKGEGIYILHMATVSAAVIYQDAEFKLIFNDSEAVREVLDEFQLLPIYEVEKATGWRLESVRGKTKRVAADINRRVLRYSAYAAATLGVLYIGLATAAGLMTKTSATTIESQQAAINTAVKSMSTVSPLSEQLAQIQKVSSITVRGGGWIDEYAVKDGKEAFRVTLPAWVTRDYIENLGGTVRADMAEDGMIAVVKGDLKPTQAQASQSLAGSQK